MKEVKKYYPEHHKIKKYSSYFQTLKSTYRNINTNYGHII